MPKERPASSTMSQWVDQNVIIKSIDNSFNGIKVYLPLIGAKKIIIIPFVRCE